jgi:hypothetical protein
MPTKQILFFATAIDLIEILKNIESKIGIKYYISGLLNENQLTKYTSLVRETIGITQFGDNNLCTSYLVINSDNEIKMRHIDQLDGKSKIGIDQRVNPESIYFRPGGQFEAENSIIEGKIGTISNEKQSSELFNAFSKEFKSRCIKVKGYLVGKDAFEKYKLGWRLTQNVGAPKEYDLQLD